jgi:hypothetical protein
MRTLKPAAAAAAVCLWIGPALTGAEKGTLRAGAARVEITPGADSALPMSGYASRTEGHQRVHDPLYVRAVVVEDGARRAALVGFDLIFVPEDFWSRVSERLSKENGIARDHILMSATHTHGGPALSRIKDEFAPRWKPWMAELEKRTAQAVREAAAAMQPARVGAGTGRASVNTNRRARMASGGWGLGINPDGVSDKTVTVVRFDSLSGDPIALLAHYSVHGTVMGPRNYQITSDLPGTTSRLVEEHFGGKVVSAFLANASGDQNPIYPPGDDFNRLAALGRILSEEVIRVAGNVRTSAKGRLAAWQKVITCPGRRMTPDSNTRENKIQFVDADPVNIRLSLLMVDNIAFAGVSGEVLTRIAQRLQKESPFASTLLLAHTNGSSGYIPDDDAYEQVSYEIWVSRLKPGCAESGIVNGFLEMMEQY